MYYQWRSPLASKATCVPPWLTLCPVRALEPAMVVRVQCRA